MRNKNNDFKLNGPGMYPYELFSCNQAVSLERAISFFDSEIASHIKNILKKIGEIC